MSAQTALLAALVCALAVGVIAMRIHARRMEAHAHRPAAPAGERDEEVERRLTRIHEHVTEREEWTRDLRARMERLRTGKWGER
jgi:hypothetical protein